MKLPQIKLIEWFIHLLHRDVGTENCISRQVQEDLAGTPASLQKEVLCRGVGRKGLQVPVPHLHWGQMGGGRRRDRDVGEKSP